MLGEALDRTLLLMRTRLGNAVSDEALLGALTETTVVLVADEENLRSHSAQCAFVAAAILMARSGHRVHLIAPDVPLIGAQPPLIRDRLIAGLLEIGKDLLPGVEFNLGMPEGSDLALIVGDSSFTDQADLTLYLNSGIWSGKLSSVDVLRWNDQEWPFGGLAAAAIAASEAFKVSMRKLGSYAASPVYDKFFAPAYDASLNMAPEDTPIAQTLGAFDCVSGGAITNGLLFALARIPEVSGRGRVIEPDRGDLTNLNRYALMRRSRFGLRKIDDLATQVLAGLKIDGINLRYDEETRAAIEPFAPNVLVGVDHIPSRWLAQQAKPEWLAIAATEGFQASVTFHAQGLACAGCAHPVYSNDNTPIPTAAFVSFIGGLMLAAVFLERIARQSIPVDRQLQLAPTLRLDRGTTREPLRVHDGCPLHHPTSPEKVVA